MQRVLRQVKIKMKSLHLLHHVKSYQDEYKTCSDPLEAQLNCHCDDIANTGVVDGIMNGVEGHQKLPLELVCIFIGNNNQTMDLAKGLHYFIGIEKAKEFYAEKDIMDPTTFNSVNWEDLHNTLAFRPKMYQLSFIK